MGIHMDRDIWSWIYIEGHIQKKAYGDGHKKGKAQREIQKGRYTKGSLLRKTY